MSEHQDDLMEILRELDISFSINPYLVRGLDYYTRTAFEIKTGSWERKMLWQEEEDMTIYLLL